MKKQNKTKKILKKKKQKIKEEEEENFKVEKDLFITNTKFGHCFINSISH